jgi:hypothetical protein
MNWLRVPEFYGVVLDSIRTGTPYQTHLNPPPAGPRHQFTR